jgi:hypothetical protein
MKKNTFLLVLLGAWMVITSCSKNDPGPSKTELLTQSDWKYSLVTSTDTGFQSYMIFVLQGSEFHFSADKTSTLTYSSSANPSTYTWSFSSDEKSLLLTNATSTIAYELVLLDGSNLHFRTTGTSTTVYKYVKK